MVAKEYAGFEPKTKIPAEEFIARMRERRINLTEQDCRSVEHALKGGKGHSAPLDWSSLFATG
jgi:hypothetical protein